MDSANQKKNQIARIHRILSRFQKYAELLSQKNGKIKKTRVDEKSIFIIGPKNYLWVYPLLSSDFQQYAGFGHGNNRSRDIAIQKRLHNQFFKTNMTTYICYNILHCYMHRRKAGISI